MIILPYSERYKPAPYIEISKSFPDGVGMDFVNEKGARIHRGTILRITPQGLTRISGMSKEFNIPLDSRGRILLNELYGE